MQNYSDFTAEVKVKPSPQRKLAIPFIASSSSTVNSSLVNYFHAASSTSSLNSTDSEDDYRSPVTVSASSSRHSDDLLSQLQKSLLTQAQWCSSSSNEEMPLKKQHSKSVENICDTESNLASHHTSFHLLR